MQITRSSIDTQQAPADWFTRDVYSQPDDTDFNAIPFGPTKQEL